MYSPFYTTHVPEDNRESKEDDDITGDIPGELENCSAVFFSVVGERWVPVN